MQSLARGMSTFVLSVIIINKFKLQLYLSFSIICQESVGR
jgi:hypothetical protein